MGKSSQTRSAFILLVGLLTLVVRAQACDRTSLSLNSVTPLGAGQYALSIRFCVGAGYSSTQTGAAADTYTFGFFLSPNAQFLSHPAQLVSPQTGYVYLDTTAGTDTLVYYSQNFNTLNYEPWACIAPTRGPVQTYCIDITIVTQGLPDSLWLGGAEGGGNLAAGCTGSDVTVYPSASGCSMDPNYVVTQPTCAGPQGGISLSPSGGVQPYTFTWSNGATTPSISNLLPATYDVTILDAASCMQTISFTIDAPAGFTIDLGPDATVYQGYAPQSCKVLSPTISEGVGPFSYQWSTGATTASLNVCPTANTTYALTVTDSRGCQATDNVLVTVVDVRCGNGNSQKVLVCHNGATACVPLAQVDNHLNHGDALGTCTNKSGEESTTEEAVALEFQLSAHPIPARDAIQFEVLSAENGTLTLEVFDLQGKRIALQSAIAVTGGSVQACKMEVSQWTPGMYIAKATHSASGMQSMKFTVVL